MLTRNAEALPVGRERATRPVRHYLIRLMVFLALPIVLGTLALIGNLLIAQRAEFDEGLLENARLLTLAIERDLQFTGAIVATLQASPLLEGEDLSTFHAYAKRALESRPGTRMVLVAPDGKGVLSTAVPYRTPLPNVFTPPAPGASAVEVKAHQDNAQSWRSFFADPKPQYSSVYFNIINGEGSVAVRYPVLRDGRVRYGLAVALPLSLVQQQLARLHPNPAWITALIDSRGLYIARSKDGERFAGKQAPPAMLQVIAGDAARVRSGESVDGHSMRFASVRSEMTGWWLAVGAPSSQVSRQVLNSAALWLTGIGLTLLLGVLLARRTWRELSASLRELSFNARAFERGEPQQWRSSPITEVEDCREAWTMALRADEQRRLEEGRRIAADARRQELEEANAEKDRLLAALSHELRNPLGAITNSVSVLNRLAPGEPRAQSMLEIIRRQTTHLTRLVDDLLDLAGATFGKMRLALHEVDLHELARLTIQPYEAAQPRITLSGGPARVLGDAVRLDQVLRNLLDNAIKFTQPEGRIEVTVRQVRDQVVLTVSDSGVGLQSELGEEIFEAFVQTEQGIDRPKGGLGLGLALVRQIVLLHGGSVTASSQGPSRGTSIIVTLPAMASASSSASASESAPAPPAARD